MSKATDDLYHTALKADAEFQDAVIRQFGAYRAGDMRYRAAEFNDETKAAQKRFLDAMEALKASWKLL